jgi:ketosteroid isomerase-like protein
MRALHLWSPYPNIANTHEVRYTLLLKQLVPADSREGGPMRSVILIFLTLLYSTPLMAQGTDTKLRSELEALHSKWFKAFDSGDGATMDLMEMDKLVLVMPTGFIWTKTAPRAGEQQKHDSQIERTLSDVSVRRFGDTAILTGILTTKSGKENSQEATTVVFLQSAGRWKIASAQWSPVGSTK